MSLFNALTGNASEVDAGKIGQEFAYLLAPGERVERAYKLVRDLILLTDKRLVLIDKQGLTGRKTAFHSVPYRAITQFSVETAGTMDLESELKIWISGGSGPLEVTLSRGVDVREVQAVLAAYVLR